MAPVYRETTGCSHPSNVFFGSRWNSAGPYRVTTASVVHFEYDLAEAMESLCRRRATIGRRRALHVSTPHRFSCWSTIGGMSERMHWAVDTVVAVLLLLPGLAFLMGVLMPVQPNEPLLSHWDWRYFVAGIALLLFG
ncbi:MAG: hypothetical protein ACT4QC_05310 [Planctomycetaceae bacterium]